MQSSYHLGIQIVTHSRRDSPWVLDVRNNTSSAELPLMGIAGDGLG